MAVTAQEILEALSGVGSPEQLKEVIELIKELTDVLPGLSGSYRKMSQEGKDAAKALDDAAQNTKNWASSVDGITDKMAGLLGVMDADSTFIGFTGNLAAAAMGSENAAFSLAELGTKLKTTFSVANIAASVATKFATAMKDLALDTDKAMVSFNRSTGAADKFGSQIIGLQRDLQPLGVGLDDITGVYTGLINNLGSFNRMSETQQRTIAENTAVLQELGVSADVTTANYNTLMSAFTMTKDQASEVQREMLVLAQTIGMPPEKMANGFQKAIPQLAAFGKKSTDVYKKLAVNAQAAGMQVDQLLRITEQFDTFEGAAQAVGKLNALLGGPYLSTTRMIQNTDPTERMRMLSSAISDAGKSFDQMEYYERKATAAAMGLADVSELALLMNNRFDLLEPQVKQSASDLEALAEQTAKFNEVGEILSNMFMSLVGNLYPVINGIKEFSGKISAFIAMYPEVKVALAGLALGIGILVIALGAVTGPVGITIAVISTLIVTISLLISYMGDFSKLVDGTTGRLSVLKFLLMYIAFAIFAPFIALFAIIYGQFVVWKKVISDVMKELEPFRAELEIILGRVFEKLGPVLAHLGEKLAWLGGATSYFFLEFLQGKKVLVAIGRVIIWLASTFASLLESVLDLYHSWFIGNSPSFLDVMGMVGTGFGFLAKAILSPITAIQTIISSIKSLYDLMSDFVKFLLSPEVMDVLGKIFDTGVAVVGKVFGIGEVGNKTDQISQAKMETEKALADSNMALKNSIDQLTKVMSESNTKGSGTVVNIDPKMEKFFEVQEKRLERRMSGRPVYSTSGGR